MNESTEQMWDGLCFAGRSLFAHDVSSWQLLAALDRAGVQGAVVAPHKPPSYEFSAANDAVLALAADHSDRLIAMCRVDPWQREAAVVELRRAVARGARGLLLHPWEECFAISDSVVDPLLDAALDVGVPVVVAGGFPWLSEAMQVAHTAQRHADLQFVVTNGAQLNMSGLAGGDVDQALADCPNIALHVSGLYRQDFLERTVRMIGAERIAFGSSSPYFDVSLEAARVRQTQFAGPRERELVLIGNTRRWFTEAGGAR